MLAYIDSPNKRQTLTKAINEEQKADRNLEKEEAACNGKLWKCFVEEMVFGVRCMRFGHAEIAIARNSATMQ